jgi:hypothetical protein
MFIDIGAIKRTPLPWTVCAKELPHLSVAHCASLLANIAVTNRLPGYQVSVLLVSLEELRAVRLPAAL